MLTDEIETFRNYVTSAQELVEQLWWGNDIGSKDKITIRAATIRGRV